MKSLNPRERCFFGKRRTHLLNHASICLRCTSTSSVSFGKTGKLSIRLRRLRHTAFHFRKSCVHSELFNRDNP